MPSRTETFRCRLCFPKQPSSSSDHLQGGKNKNKTKHGSRSLKGSIWTTLKTGDGSRTWPCLASAMPITAGRQPTSLFLHLGKIRGFARASKCPLCLLAICVVKPCSGRGDAEPAFGASGLSVSACGGLALGQGLPFAFMLLGCKGCHPGQGCWMNSH